MRRAIQKVLSLYGGMSTGKLVGLFLGPFLLAAVTWSPIPLDTPQHRLFGVIVFTVTYWAFQPVPIPITAILSLALLVLLEVAPASEVFGAFSSSTLFLLIGSFIMTQAMIKHGLGQRIALRVLSLPGISGSTHRIVLAFGGLAAVLSGVMDNGALSAMLLPIAVGLIDALEPDIRKRSGETRRHLRFGSALLLMTAYGATVGALLTPFGDAANLVGWQFIREQQDPSFDVSAWMTLSVPIVFALFGALTIVVLLVNRPEVGRIPEGRALILERRAALGPMSVGEQNTGLAFGLAVFLWLLPPLVAVLTGINSPAHAFLVDKLHPAAVAVLAASFLFVLPVAPGGTFTLRWRDTKLMDWGPVLLVGGALALGRMMANTGLAEVLGQTLALGVAGMDSTAVYVACATTALLISELTTNLVSVSVIVPILPGLTAAGDAEPLTAALVATFASIYGFMLPISTSANAIIYSSGKVPFGRMVKTGALVDLVGIILIVVGVTTMTRILSMP